MEIPPVAGCFISWKILKKKKKNMNDLGAAPFQETSTWLLLGGISHASKLEVHPGCGLRIRAIGELRICHASH